MCDCGRGDSITNIGLQNVPSNSPTHSHPAFVTKPLGQGRVRQGGEGGQERGNFVLCQFHLSIIPGKHKRTGELLLPTTSQKSLHALEKWAILLEPIGRTKYLLCVLRFLWQNLSSPNTKILPKFTRLDAPIRKIVKKWMSSLKFSF